MSRKILNKTTAYILSIATVVGLVPVATSIPAYSASYESKYPDRITDELVFDNLEEYQIGDTISRMQNKYQGKTWWDPSNNQNEFGIVDEVDGTKVISYQGEHDYTSFASPGNKKLTEKLWIDVDIKLPENYYEYRFQIGDKGGHPDRIGLSFYKNDTKLEAFGVQNPAGGKGTIELTKNIPQNQWFTLSILLDNEREKFKVYIDGVQYGREMNFNYKFGKETCTYAGHPDIPCPEAGFSMMRFAHRGEENLSEPFEDKIYFDNYRLGYARSIKTLSTTEITIDLGDSFQLPDKLLLELDNGTKREFGVEWTPVGPALPSVIDTLGSYHYEAKIEHYSSIVDYWIYVKDRTINSVPTVYEKAYLGDTSYAFPSKVTAIMDDGSEKQVDVVWQGTPDVSNAGTTTYYGRVDGYSEDVLLNLEILANAVMRVDDFYMGVARGDSYQLPNELRVIFENHKYGKAKVKWEDVAAGVDTSVLGKYVFEGRVDGYNEKVKLHITVYEKDEDLDYIESVLKEFYDNVLTTGRDRSQWFPDEYAAGYDPALGMDYDYSRSGIDGKPYSPLPSMGIDRNTGTHALWPSPSRNMPLAVPATQSPLWRGLQGFSAITGDDKYFEAALEAHEYLINNKVDPDGHIIRWGDHILQQFDSPTLEHQQESDSYSYFVHQLECDTPEIDLLFSGNAEATERYVKTFWAAHFNGRDNGVMFDTMEFSRHATVNNVWDEDVVNEAFKARYPVDENGKWIDVKVHKPSQGFLTFINAAIDYVWTGIKLYQQTGDTDVLHYVRKLLWCYHESAHDETGLVPFMYTDTYAYNSAVSNVFHPHYLVFLKDGRAQDSYSKVYRNPEKYGTTKETVTDSHTLNQGKNGGGSFYMPLICFRVADILGGEMGKEIEQWGIEAMMGFVNYTYDYKTGLGKSGFTDGTVLDDYKPEYTSYYAVAGRTQWPFTISSDMTWLLLDGYERTGNEKIWECLRSMCMSLSLGDIGTAPGVNIDVEKYTKSDDSNVLMTLARLYEITGKKEYYNLAMRVTKNILNTRYINGFFYKSSNGAYARMSDPAPYCILYFLASARGESEMIPEYMGESFDFQTQYVQDDGSVTDSYGKTLFDKTIVSEVYASAILCDINEIELNVDEQKKIHAEVFPDNASNLKLEWSVDDTSVCIAKDGVVTAIAPGKCVVTAETTNGISKSIRVTVK